MRIVRRPSRRLLDLWKPAGAELSRPPTRQGPKLRQPWNLVPRSRRLLQSPSKDPLACGSPFLLSPMEFRDNSSNVDDKASVQRTSRCPAPQTTAKVVGIFSD